MLRAHYSEHGLSRGNVLCRDDKSRYMRRLKYAAEDPQDRHQTTMTASHACVVPRNAKSAESAEKSHVLQWGRGIGWREAARGGMENRERIRGNRTAGDGGEASSECRRVEIE